MVIGCIDNAAGCIFNLRKILASKAINGKNQTIHLRRNARQIYHDLLIVPITITGAIISGMNYRAILRFQLPEPDGINLIALHIK